MISEDPAAIHCSPPAIAITDTIDYGPGSDDSIRLSPSSGSYNHATMFPKW